MANISKLQLQQLLTTASIAYQANHSIEVIEALARIYLDLLAGEDADGGAVARAFKLHMKTNSRFPTPAHIIALLPECRRNPEQLELPEAEGKRTPGYAGHMCKAILRNLRSGGTAPLSKAAAQAMQNIMQGMEAR